jgi:flagellar basal body P-ring formation protein FlgA
MIRTTRAAIHTTLATLALVVALAGAALAQTAPPKLRANITVNSDLVRIGDLVENAGAVADVPIFRSPDLGTTGAVSTEAVIAAIRPYQLIDINTGGLSEVTVTRASRIIGPQEVSARIEQALASQYGLGKAQKIALTFDRPLHALAVEPNATGELQVAALDYDPHTSRFDVTLDLASSLVLHRQLPRFTGTAVATVDAVTVAHPVERGEVLQASDLTVLREPSGAEGIITDTAAVVGFAAIHALRPGQPLRAADLIKPKIVRRDETVTLTYEVPGLMLTLRGKAQQDGALGDTISVLNPQTKRVVEGVVTGPGRVGVNAAGQLHFAENTVSSALRGGSAPAQQKD